jgi:hypothetical protein
MKKPHILTQGQEDLDGLEIDCEHVTELSIKVTNIIHSTDS